MPGRIVMHPDDLLARVHKAAVAAQGFLLTGGPSGQASVAAVDALCASLREANLPPLCLESVVHRVLRSLHRGAPAAMPIADPDTHDGYAPPFADPVERFRHCALQLVRARVETPERVRETLEVIARRATEPNLRLSDVAGDVNLSARHLSHLLKTSTGFGFRRHLRSVRLARAAEMFRERACRVKEVWAAVGYSHASEFGRHFKACYGLTPREYRTSMAGHAPSGPPPAAGAVAPWSGHGAGRREHARQAGPEASVPGRLILIVDDDPATTDGLCRLMRRAGYDALAAHGLSAALEVASGREPDVAILDYRMPDANGVECVRVLGTRPGFARTRFFILTGDCSALDHMDELSARNGLVVFKPLDPDDLLMLVNRAIDAV